MKNSSRYRQTRLDASESIFFERELEAIDAKVYARRYPALKARSFVPVVSGIPEWARVYTWRESDEVGSAEFIAPGAVDLPRVDVVGTETTKVIKRLGDSYGYDVFEIKEAAAMGKSLDADRAAAARRAMERKIDGILATGNSAHGLTGMLNLANTTSYTLGTKVAGGLTWGTLAAPNATGEEVAADLMGIATKGVEATAEEWDRFMIVLPLEQYNYAAQKRLGSNSDLTALEFAKKTSPYIEDIRPWRKCDGAGSGATDRIMAFPRDPDVLAAIVPMEFTPMAPQLRGTEWIINCFATCGGVVARYPFAVVYGDGC